MPDPKRLQIQTGPNGCCNPDDPCALNSFPGGHYIDIDGTWADGLDGGINYHGTSDPAALSKWSHASSYGDRYHWCGWLKIENDGDKAQFYFGYNVATDAYEGYVEVTAGDPTTGVGGNYKVYVGGVLKTSIDSDFSAGNWHGFGICIGANIRTPCAEGVSDMYDTINTIGVTDGAAGGFCWATRRYGWAAYTVTPSNRGWAVGSGGANTGYVRWSMIYWYKTNVVADFPITGGYDCSVCDDECSDCFDDTRKTNCTVTFDTPTDITNSVPNMAEQFENQSFELLKRPNELGSSGCTWNIADWTDDVLYDDGMGGTTPVSTTFGINLRIVCCEGEYYLALTISAINFIIALGGGGACDIYYYHLPSFDRNCDFGELTLDDGNTVDEVNITDCKKGCGGGTFTNSPTGQFILGGNSITLNFHN